MQTSGKHLFFLHPTYGRIQVSTFSDMFEYMFEYMFVSLPVSLSCSYIFVYPLGKNIWGETPKNNNRWPDLLFDAFRHVQRYSRIF